MTNETQEQERKPALEITRTKRFNFSGKKEHREQVVTRNFDNSGRMARLTNSILTQEIPETGNSDQRYFSQVMVYDWSEDGKKCEITHGHQSLSGSFKPICKERTTYNSKGDIIQVESYRSKTKRWEEGGIAFCIGRDPRQIKRDIEGRITELFEDGYQKGRKLEFFYDSQGRLGRVLIFDDMGKPEIIQQIEYPRQGSKKIMVYPCKGQKIGWAAIYGISGYIEKLRTNSGKIIQNVRYIETRRERTGKDQEEKDYHATLAQGWLEDIVSGKRIDGTKFSEMKIEK